MNQRWRLASYILVNIVVSACVTGAILFFYDRTNQAVCGQSAGALPVLSAQASENVQLEIVSVVGAGIASSEIVVIQNVGSETALLTDWYLQESGGSAYLFPQIYLNPNASVQVHTTSGADTARDLYWGRTEPAWSSGETATLFDPYGTPYAFYVIP